jgi:hypothetical protein
VDETNPFVERCGASGAKGAQKPHDFAMLDSYENVTRP